MLLVLIELPQQVEAIQMSTTNICFYKENQEEKKQNTKKRKKKKTKKNKQKKPQKHCICIIR